MEQALLLALIVLVTFHVWQNLGGEVATVAGDGGDSVQAAHVGSGDRTPPGHDRGWGDGHGGGRGHNNRGR